jgi:wyosine [tRNA(Phe)-imidazoG37] synthetase (radical SAM superfamily)
LVRAVRERSPYPIAILTNSSLMTREDMRRDLALFDLVAAKVDAPNEALFQAINRPFVPYSLEEIVEGIRRFREGFTGRLALQMMFVEANKDHASEMAQLACELQADEVQLNTPLRPSPVSPLSPEEMEAIEGAFEGLNVLNVYKAERPEVVPLEESETRRRRPKKRVQAASNE